MHARRGELLGWLHSVLSLIGCLFIRALRPFAREGPSVNAGTSCLRRQSRGNPFPFRKNASVGGMRSPEPRTTLQLVVSSLGVEYFTLTVGRGLIGMNLRNWNIAATIDNPVALVRSMTRYESDVENSAPLAQLDLI